MDTDGGYFEPNCKRQIPAHHLGSAPGVQRSDHSKTRRPATETNLSRSAGGDVFDEFKAGFCVDYLGCGASTETGIQMCPTLGTDSCFGTATKLGPARFRLVHLLCPFGKAFYGDLWRHRSHPCPRKVNTDAYSKGRRREDGFDASNAFMSVHHTTLHKLVETSFEDERDRALMMQRYRGAQISLCANADEPRVEIVPSCGFLRGDVTGLLFLTMSTVSKSPNNAAKRRTETRSTYMRSVFSRVTSMMHHPPFFADDITKRTVTKTPQEVITKVEKASKLFKTLPPISGLS